MKEPELPDDETARLQALRTLQVLDTADEQRFDRLTRLAKDFFGVEIVLVSLIDETRQWFKSRQGLSVRQTERRHSFCAHALHSDATLEVQDTWSDPRFHDNPLVTGPPNIRFYAGAPLRAASGHRVGTLCLIDSRPRTLDEKEHQQLRDLADTVESELNRQTEHTLLKRLASIIDGTNAGTWEWNVRTGETVINERWANLVGYTLEELTPTRVDTWYSLTHPDDLELSEEALARHFSGENDFYDVELRMRHKDGHWIWVHDRGRIVTRDGDGDPLWVAGTRTDITGEVNSQRSLSRQLRAFEVLNSIAADEALSHSRRLQRALELGADFLGLELGLISQIDGDDYYVLHSVSPDGIDRFKGEVFRTSHTYCQLTLESEDVVAIQHMGQSDYAGHPCYAAFGLESYIGIHISLAGEIAGTLNFSSSSPREHPFSDSERLFIRLLGRWVGASLERHRALTELRLSESRFRALFELSPIGIALNDFDSGQFIEVNDALLRSSGYTREEFINLDYFQITPTEYFNDEQRMRESLIEQGRYGPFEKEYVNRAGTRYPVLLNGVLAEDTHGKRLIWSIVEDISERKRIERMKDEFIATVSHELRTPLTSITGSLRLLSAGVAGELPQEAKGMLEIAYNNGQRLSYLINDLLDMEKLVSGKLSMQSVDQPLLPLVEAAIRDNQSYAGDHGVSFRLAPTETDPLVHVDGNRLQQVLANLLSNAAKFSPPDSDVIIALTTDESEVTVAITDHGPGIPESFRPRLFRKFSQADASDQRSRYGTGLGLAITKALIDQMDGEIGVESVEGKGATFYFTLPIVHKDARSGSAERRPLP